MMLAAPADFLPIPKGQIQKIGLSGRAGDASRELHLQVLQARVRVAELVQFHAEAIH